MDAEERHWTDDSELIERFVLNRLDPDERNELEDHLRVCEVCKRAVRAEQLLIAGIRRSGRERFKAELQKKISHTEHIGLPWPHILSAAAVVIILVSVAFYNRWFDIVKPPERETPPAVPRTSDTVTEHDRSLTEPARLQSREETPADLTQRREQSERASKEAPLARQLRQTPRELPQAPGTADTRGQHLEGEQHRAQAPALTSVRESEIWLDGELILQAPDAMAAPGEQPPPAPQKLKDKAATAQSRQVHGLTFVLHRRTLEDMPGNRARAASGDISMTVPTRLHRSSDTVYVSVYFDALPDEAAWSQAAVEVPTADSLIVSLPGRRIVYRLPEGWHMQ